MLRRFGPSMWSVHATVVVRPHSIVVGWAVIVNRRLFRTCCGAVRRSQAFLAIVRVLLLLLRGELGGKAGGPACVSRLVEKFLSRFHRQGFPWAAFFCCVFSAIAALTDAVHSQRILRLVIHLSIR